MPRTRIEIPKDEGMKKVSDIAPLLFGAIIGLLFAFLLTGCTSSKKTTTTHLLKIDSSSSFISKTNTDTASHNSVIKASDIDIDYYYDTAYDPAVVALATAKVKNTQAAATDDPVLSFVPDHSRLVAIHVHVGDLSDSSSSTASSKSVDTAHRQAVTHTDLAQIIVEKKTLIPWWLYVAGGILLLVIILIMVYKIVK